jgi:predicted CXXCH cytochrome family protein
MYNILVGHSKGAKEVGDRITRLLFGVFLWPALLGGCTALSAQEPKPPAKPIPTVKPHVPLGGKECSECHRRVVPSKVNCPLAKDDLCGFCHQVPSEGGLTRLVEAPEPLCFKCHKKDQFKSSFVHGPFAAGACIACHDPHGGNVPGMLRITDPQICLGCHANIQARFSNAKFRHKAAVTRCTDCHSPHGSDQRYTLKTAVPALCGNCHEKIVKDYQTAAVKHSPVTEAPACMNCHDPHMAADGRLLIAEEVDTCLKCHDKTVKAGQLDLADMKLLLASNPVHHGPIQNRDCSGCHNPHSSPYFRLLTNDYPKGFYSPYFPSKYALCFRCHDSGLAKEERTTTLTGFRDGDRNLHFVHVNRASNGRTCRSCHDVHASGSPKYIGQTVPFGKWKLPIKFVITADGGGCEPGCHEAQKYDRQLAKSR